MRQARDHTAGSHASRFRPASPRGIPLRELRTVHRHRRPRPVPQPQRRLTRPLLQPSLPRRRLAPSPQRRPRTHHANTTEAAPAASRTPPRRPPRRSTRAHSKPEEWGLSTATSGDPSLSLDTGPSTSTCPDKPECSWAASTTAGYSVAATSPATKLKHAKRIAPIAAVRPPAEIHEQRRKQRRPRRRAGSDDGCRPGMSASRAHSCTSAGVSWRAGVSAGCHGVGVALARTDPVRQDRSVPACWPAGPQRRA